MQLLYEATKLEGLIKNEDWEIDKDILNFILKNHGKKSMKKVIVCIKKRLDVD